MATAFHVSASSVSSRHKRKGVPMRSPCRRDMPEIPGVVFRFPDKISALRDTITHPSAPSNILSPVQSQPTTVSAVVSSSLQQEQEQIPVIGILPSSAGLPNNLMGVKTAEIIAAAAAVNNIKSSATPIDTNTTTTSTPGASTNAYPSSDKAGQLSLERLDKDKHNHHCVASNVLHYPELLSDLRDKLVKIQQQHQAQLQQQQQYNNNDNSDDARPAAGSGRGGGRKRTKASHNYNGNEVQAASSARRRAGLRGAHNRSSPGAVVSRTASDMSGASALAGGKSGHKRRQQQQQQHGDKTSSSASQFQRRHSTGTIHSQLDDEEDDIDGDDSESNNGSSSGARAAAAAAGSTDGDNNRNGNGTDGEDEVVDIINGVVVHATKARGGSSSLSSSGKRKRDVNDDSGANGNGVQHQHSGSPSANAKRASSSGYTGGTSSSNSSRRSCASCGVNSTPCWRPGWIDSMTLCNSCGLRYKKGRVYCAACCYVPMKTEIATGGAIVCKRCSSNIQSTAGGTSSSS